MIVGTHDIESSDAASTNTLVSGQRQKIPRYLPTLVYCSFCVSSLAFTFAIVDSVNNPYYLVPKGVIAPIMAYICTLPYHSAILLLKWLERHQTESILPFAPSSPRAIAYSLISLGLWVASTAVCAINLRRGSAPWETCTIVQDSTTTLGFKCGPYYFVRPGVDAYWSSLASTVTSSLELIIALSITSICYTHFSRLNKTIQVAPSPTATPESKILSA